MKRIFSALVAALCIVLSAEARDTDAHIHGHIIDKNTGEHLPYMVVVLKGTTIGVTASHLLLRCEAYLLKDPMYLSYLSL